MELVDNLQQRLSAAMDGPSKWWDDLKTITHRADVEAEARFPDQERDDSQKNAYRHALGAGGFAQLLGANSGIPLVEGAARGAAKLVGYGWEGLGGMANYGSTDMRHDLNANAIGIAQSTGNPDFRSLADSLQSFAQGARKELPPEPYEKARPYFTYTK